MTTRLTHVLCVFGLGTRTKYDTSRGGGKTYALLFHAIRLLMISEKAIKLQSFLSFGAFNLGGLLCSGLLDSKSALLVCKSHRRTGPTGTNGRNRRDPVDSTYDYCEINSVRVRCFVFWSNISSSTADTWRHFKWYDRVVSSAAVRIQYSGDVTKSRFSGRTRTELVEIITNPTVRLGSAIPVEKQAGGS